MYKLFEQGPDDNSTYPECWGSTATSNGRLIAESDTLRPVVEAAVNLGHNNFAVMHGRSVKFNLLRECKRWLSQHQESA